MEHRHRRQHDVLGRSAVDQAIGNGLVHDARMRMHAAFGKPGGTAGIGQYGQVPRAIAQRRRRLRGGHRGIPCEYRAAIEPRQRMPAGQPGDPRRWRRVVALHLFIEGIRQMGHDQMRQAQRGVQPVTGCGQFGSQIGGRDRHLGIRIGDAVLEFLRPIHRVDRNHHRVGAQDGPVRDDELRAVLHVEQYAVAPGHAQQLQAGREPLGLHEQLLVGRDGAKKHHG